MKEYPKIIVRLNSIDNVKNFVNDISKVSCECDLEEKDSRHVVDAKSIMGIFSLNLTKDLTLIPMASTDLQYDAVKNAAAPYVPVDACV